VLAQPAGQQVGIPGTGTATYTITLPAAASGQSAVGNLLDALELLVKNGFASIS
jgi:hypothetical protein